MRQTTDDSEKAFRVLLGLLEDALRSGATSIELEWEGGELIVYFFKGITGIGASRVPREQEQELIEEIVKRARLSRSPKGKMQVGLLGKDYEVVVEVYDSFGDSAFGLTLKEPRKKATR